MTITRSDYVKRSIEGRQQEAEYVRRIVAALEANGGTVTHVNDSEEQVPVNGVEDVLTLAFNLDECSLIVNTRGSVSFVFLTMGEFPDTVCDYGTDLDAAIEPLTDWAYSQ